MVQSALLYTRGFKKFAEKCCHRFNTHEKCLFSLHMVNQHILNIYTTFQRNQIKNHDQSPCFSKISNVKPAQRRNDVILTLLHVSNKTRT